MSDNDADRRAVEEYQRVVLAYETLDQEIDTLLNIHRGNHEAMPAEELQRYRELARQRDDLYNTMRYMEQQFLENDDSISNA